MKNEIYLRRMNKVLITSENNKVSVSFIATMLKNLESLGYTMSKELIDAVMTLSEKSLEGFNQSLIENLKVMTGAHKKYNPMYPNFPKQVMEMEEAELYFNAILHYLGRSLGIRIMPKYEKEDRIPLLDNVDLKTINLGTTDEFKNIFTNLIGANTSISDVDKDDIKWCVENYKQNGEIFKIIPKNIPQKENLAYISALLMSNFDIKAEALVRYYKTATDVLRLATAISEGDVSLASNTAYKSFKRSERRLLLGLLDQCNNIEEDMLRYKSKWKRLGERLHPSEYKRFKNVVRAFNKIRNNKKIETFNGKVEALLESSNVDSVVKLLGNRPGEFARRLDHLIRKTDMIECEDRILTPFSKVVKDISSPVLLQVMAHFKHRNKGNDKRIFFPKGDTAKAQVRKNDLQDIDESICSRIVEITTNTLKLKYSEKGDLGKVYIDDRLKNYLVPFSQRSASKSLKTLVRGSRIPMDEGSTIRFFLWWKNIDEASITDSDGYMELEVDIDLSAIMYDKDWNYKEHISYTNLKSSKYRSCHSGDVVSAPNGDCEFIDIDIDSLSKFGGRYIVMNVLSYSDQMFSELDECFVGWMMRKEPDSGEIFDARMVNNKLDVRNNSRLCLPIIIDIEKREIIWSDLAIKASTSFGGNNIESNKASIPMIAEAISSLNKPNLYELFSLHAESRATIVDSPKEADIVFSIDGGENAITPFDIEEIMGQYL